MPVPPSRPVGEPGPPLLAVLDMASQQNLL